MIIKSLHWLLLVEPRRQPRFWLNDWYLRDLTLRVQELNKQQSNGWKASGRSRTGDKLLVGCS